MKSLKRLERDNLLKSKSYGLAEEKLWSLKKNKLLVELGYIAPKSDIHKYNYDHTKRAGDIFVSLALSGSLYLWEGEGNRPDLRWDRKFAVDDRDFYLEVETGSQDIGKLRLKTERYLRYWEEIHEPFNVLFTVGSDAGMRKVLTLFTEYRLNNHYMVVSQSDFVSSPFTADIYTRFGINKLSNHAENH
jgi:hypothetical protein